MTEQMFEQATRLKLRYSTTVGMIEIEDLWDLALTSTTGRPNLDDVARALHRQLKSDDTNVSFVNTEAKPNAELQLAFDIVKHVIDVRVAERKKANEAQARAEQKQKILGIIAERRDEDLKGKPLEDLERMVNEL